MNMINKDAVIAVIGLGYVGLPLALAFSKKRKVIGFDVNQTRVDELSAGFDRTGETESYALLAGENVTYCSDPNIINNCSVFIVATPTPVDVNNEPDLSILISACKTIGSFIKTGNVVIFESTVFPGATEEVCVPVLEKTSGLVFNKDFFCGYSPERINPGDKTHTLEKIVKVTSGSTRETADAVDNLYKEIITAGTYKAPSIKVAEAAKVIENTQRDLNVAFVNELSMLFHELGIDTKEVLEAAKTKWNFLDFVPGLVGGHCIGVDPYYLSYKAKQVGFHTNIISAGRETNEQVTVFVSDLIVKKLKSRGVKANDCNVLILGATFKENVGDLRNSKVTVMVEYFSKLGMNVAVHDENAEAAELRSLYLDKVQSSLPPSDLFDVIVLASPHQLYLDIGVSTIKSWMKANGVFCDLKSVFAKEHADVRL